MKRLATIVAVLISAFICPTRLSASGERLVSAEQTDNAGSEAPAISLSRNGNVLTITFTGTLQSADSIAGPWTDVPNAASPFTQDLAATKRFYRTRELESIFDSRSIVAFTLTAPLQAHFDLAFAGMPDGIFPPVRQKMYFDGTISMGDLQIPASVRVRGNSSLQECPFPKLKFKVSKQNRAGTPFFDAREVKIATHCADGGRGTIGRLRDQTATYREALAYEVMELIGFTTPRVRRARIEYRDTTPRDASSDVGWQVVRLATILDDVEVVAERLGGRALDDEEVATLPDAGFDEQLIADLRLLHVLFGNWDFALSQIGRELWNTDVIELADGKRLPVAGDFDLASWVTEVVMSDAPHDYYPELPEIDRRARFELSEIEKRVGTSRFETAANRFLSHRTAIETHILSAEVDEPGRANALQHATSFFNALTFLKR